MLNLYNTMTKIKQEVSPVDENKIKMYTCGPTVYRDAHIGNLRSYLLADWIRRALEFQGYNVDHVKNITDVGHMRQEVLERGEDKIIAAALAEGKTAAEIAQFYTDRFLADEQALNIRAAMCFPKATDHIDEMLEIVENLEERGLAYEVEGNVYFEVAKFSDYGKLSGNLQDSELLSAVRVDPDPLKRDPRDFTLWKAAEPGRLLKWSSKWGDGFPGWHIECSAMSIKYLGKRFDIHTGGVDNIFPHHEGEIAQSEGFTGEDVVSIWVHGQHLLADGVKMAKSTGNSFILSDIEAQGIDPLAFRYLCLSARYQSRLNFTFTALKAAQRGLLRLQNRVWDWSRQANGTVADESAATAWFDKFTTAINDNLNMPVTLSLTWELAKSDESPATKLNVMSKFDSVLGLSLDQISDRFTVTSDISAKSEQRTQLRQSGDYSAADAIRSDLSDSGYLIEDGHNHTRVRPKTAYEKHQEAWDTISSAAEVSSLEDEPDIADLTIGITAHNYIGDVQRCIQSSLKWIGDINAEVVVLDSGSSDGTSEWLEEASKADPRIKVIHSDHMLGEGAAKNTVMKQSRGNIVVLLDTSVEVKGDIFSRIRETLSDDSIGVFGPFGLRTDDLHHFHDGEGEAGDMDAMQAYCFAFKRKRLKSVGFARESFRFYRNLDLDYSFQFKEQGLRVVADPSLPVELHEHRMWEELGEGERDEFSLKNYRRFLDRWGERTDLLVDSGHDHDHEHGDDHDH